MRHPRWFYPQGVYASSYVWYSACLVFIAKSLTVWPYFIQASRTSIFSNKVHSVQLTAFVLGRNEISSNGDLHMLRHAERRLGNLVDLQAREARE